MEVKLKQPKLRLKQVEKNVDVFMLTLENLALEPLFCSYLSYS